MSRNLTEAELAEIRESVDEIRAWLQRASDKLDEVSGLLDTDPLPAPSKDFDPKTFMGVVKGALGAKRPKGKRRR